MTSASAGPKPACNNFCFHGARTASALAGWTSDSLTVTALAGGPAGWLDAAGCVAAAVAACVAGAVVSKMSGSVDGRGLDGAASSAISPTRQPFPTGL